MPSSTQITDPFAAMEPTNPNHDSDIKDQAAAKVKEDVRAQPWKKFFQVESAAWNEEFLPSTKKHIRLFKEADDKGLGG